MLRPASANSLCRARGAFSAAIIFAVLFAAPPAALAQVLFSGYTWQVRSGIGNPGKNTFTADNVSVDANGYLHLRIAHNHNQWTTSEVFSADAFGFGTYEFQISGHPELMDDNVVLGLFNYPTADPDTTNEIDIEFATWGGQQSVHGNWTVWPAELQAGLGPTTFAFDASPAADTSTYRFTWTPRQVHYEALNGWTDDAAGLYRSWTFAPADYALRVPQHPIPVHMNLWLFEGNAPTDRQDVDITIARFRFVPECIFADAFETVMGSCVLK